MSTAPSIGETTLDGTRSPSLKDFKEGEPTTIDDTVLDKKLSTIAEPRRRSGSDIEKNATEVLSEEEPAAREIRGFKVNVIFSGLRKRHADTLISGSSSVYRYTQALSFMV